VLINTITYILVSGITDFLLVANVNIYNQTIGRYIVLNRNTRSVANKEIGR
jgi:hypothetical protein